MKGSQANRFEFGLLTVYKGPYSKSQSLPIRFLHLRSLCMFICCDSFVVVFWEEPASSWVARNEFDLTQRGIVSEDPWQRLHIVDV